MLERFTTHACHFSNSERTALFINPSARNRNKFAAWDSNVIRSLLNILSSSNFSMDAKTSVIATWSFPNQTHRFYWRPGVADRASLREREARQLCRCRSPTKTANSGMRTIPAKADFIAFTQFAKNARLKLIAAGRPLKVKRLESASPPKRQQRLSAFLAYLTNNSSQPFYDAEEYKFWDIIFTTQRLTHRRDSSRQ